jgi:WS/DGAT/MGAT family acyltransferase
MERLSPMDAAFYFGEDGRSHNDVGVVLVFDGTPPSRSELASLVAARLSLVPRFRQRVREIPLAAGLPVWIDDVSFSVDRHVAETRAGLTLEQAVSEVMSSQLDHGLPLWQIHLIAGLQTGWALVVRMHHAMVDGITSTEIVQVLLSESPHIQAEPAEPWQPAPEPSDAELLAGAAADTAGTAMAAAAAARKTMLNPPPPPSPDTLPKLDLTQLHPAGLPIPPGAMTGTISAGRHWAVREFPLDTIKDIRRRHGGTVNDVLLSVSAAGFTALLRRAGQQVDGRVLVCLVPVSLREGASARSGNEIGAIPVELPLGSLPAVEALRRVKAQTAAWKSLRDAVPARAMMSGPAFTTPAMLTMGSRMAALAPSWIHTVISNVPGPQHPLYLAGRRLRQFSACIALWAPLRIAVAMLSYDGAVTLGVVTDRASIPDAGPFLDGVTEALRLLDGGTAR